jgi:hypothetical protein
MIGVSKAVASGWWRVARKERDKIQRRRVFTTEDTESTEKRGPAEQRASEEDSVEKNSEMERMVMPGEGGTPLFFVSRGNKGLTGGIVVSRGNKGVRAEVASDEWRVARNAEDLRAVLERRQGRVDENRAPPTRGVRVSAGMIGVTGEWTVSAGMIGVRKT